MIIKRRYKMFTSSVSASTPSTTTYSAPSCETAGSIAAATPSIFSVETAGSVASSGFSVMA